MAEYREYRMNKFEYGTDTFILEDERLIGMNLIPLSKNLESFTHEEDSRTTVIHNFDDCVVTNTYASSSTKYGIYYDVDVVSNETYSLSFNISSKSGSTFFAIGNRTSGQSASWTNVVNYVALVVGQNTKTFTIPSGMTRIRIYICAQDQNSTFTISKIKLERGATVTEWTPFWIETSDGGIKTYSVRDPQGTLTEILSTVTDIDAKAVNSSLTTSSTDDDWLKALLVAICKKYPNKSGHVFKGKLTPNSSGIYKIYIYNTSTVDSTTKLPEYSFGLFRKWGQIYKTFSTSSYVFTCSDVNTNTWRGIQNNLTSTSTTDSLSAYQGKILNDTKVAKDGDTMTGTITFNNVTNAIAYKGTKATYNMIKFKDNTSDTYGNGIVIGGGGLVVVGSGESADAVASTYSSGGNEELSLASDGSVVVWANVNGGATSTNTNLKKFVFGADGILTLSASGTITSGNTGAVTGDAVYTALGNYLKWQTSTASSANLYDFGVYSALGTSGAVGPSGGNYYTLLNVPYRKASGNTKPDWGWTIGSDTANNDKFYFRKGYEATWRDWRQFAHIAANTAVGNTSHPVYVDNTGTVTACTAFQAEHTAGGGREFNVKYGSTVNMSFMIGSGDVNHGIYDHIADKWMIMADGSGNVTVNGNATSATTATTLSGKIVPTLLSTGDLNDLKDDTNATDNYYRKVIYYYASGGNNISNNPANSKTTPDTDTGLQFGMVSYPTAYGHITQELTCNNDKWMRTYLFSTTSWTDWSKFLTSSNYSNYAVKKDGSNATGTWNISVSGNAATATAADKAAAANLTTNTNGVPYFTNTNGTFGNIRSASGAFYSTGQDVKPTFGTLPIAQGGTGATTALNAANSLKVPYLDAYGTAITNGSNIDTDYNEGGTYYSGGQTITETLSGNYPRVSSGFKMYTIVGYTNDQRYRKQIIFPAEVGTIIFRGKDSSSNWGEWNKVVRIQPDANHDFQNIGGSTQPVYVDRYGIVTACTYSLKATVNNGTAGYMAYYSGANAVSSSNSIGITNTPETKDGNGNTTIEAHQNLYLNHEGVIYFRVPRKVANGGGWATTPLRFIDASQTAYAFLGLHGNNNTFNWIYIGSNDYNSNLNLKIKPNGDVQANNYISNYLTTGQLTATSANIGTLAVTGNSTFSNNISILGKIDLNRASNASYGRISYYSPTYRTWYTYMSNITAGAAPTGGTPSQLGAVTAWALRSLIENGDKYGWIWEASSNAAPSSSSVTPTAIMSLSSNKGWLRIAPVTATTTTCGNSALTIDSATNNSGGNVGLEFYRSSSGNSIASWQIGVEGNDLHIRDNYTTTSQTTYANDQIKIACNTGNVVMRGALTLGDYVTINHATECGFVINNTQSSNPKKVGLIVGRTTGNGGIWDYTKERWVVYSDPSGNVVLNGTANNSNNLLNFTTTKKTALNTINSGNIDATDATNAIGYVNGLTAAAWNGNQANGALFRQYYDSTHAYQIFGDYRSGQMALRGRSSSTWHSWRIVLDTVNYTNYVIGKDGGTINGILNINNTLNADNITTGNLIVNGNASFTQGVYATNVGCVTPQMFGAYGDGTHDDTVAIQKALDASLEVYFPPTSTAYMVSAPLIVRNHSHLWGLSSSSLIRVTTNFNKGNFTSSNATLQTFVRTYAQFGNAVFVVIDGVTSKALGLTSSNHSNFNIEHLKIDCQNVSYVCGIRLFCPYNDSRVRDVVIDNCAYRGIWIGDETTQDVMVDTCGHAVKPVTGGWSTYSDNDFIKAVRSQTLVIDNCYIGGSGSTEQKGALIHAYNSFELNLKDTKLLFKSTNPWNQPCLYLDWGTDAYVRGCSFAHTFGEAIRITGYSRYFRFIGNTYENLGTKCNNTQSTPNPNNVTARNFCINCNGNLYATDSSKRIAGGLIIETLYDNVPHAVKLEHADDIAIIGDISNIVSDSKDYEHRYILHTGTGGWVSDVLNINGSNGNLVMSKEGAMIGIKDSDGFGPYYIRAMTTGNLQYVRYADSNTGQTALTRTMATTTDVDNLKPTTKVYTAATSTNTQAAPYGAVSADISLASDISSYGTPCGIAVTTSAASNCATACIIGNNLRIYSRTAATSGTVTVRITYYKAAQINSV